MKVLIIVAACCLLGVANACTVTTASGTHAPPQGSYCSGALIFEDNFDTLDHGRWQHEVTMAGGGNWEFQWYVNDRFNSYTTGGNLHIRTSFTSDTFGGGQAGENFLRSGRIVIPDNECTQHDWYGCDRTGHPDNILNPIRSARVHTIDSFRFKYGRLEIRAKIPSGDWLWPALWLMPRWAHYGGWPRSGEIDLMESRGNRALYNGGTQVGTQQVHSTLHFGPAPEFNGFHTATGARNQFPGYNDNFHTYTLVWHPGYLQFLVDGNHINTVDAGSGFWDRGGFWNSGHANPWAHDPIAPFDQEFFIIMNMAVGGTNGYFSDGFTNHHGAKPWTNPSSRARTDFWEARPIWEPTWNNWGNHVDESHFQIDYVRVWAL